MGRIISTRLDILHPDLSAKISERTKSADHPTPRVFDIGEPVMLKIIEIVTNHGSKELFKIDWGLLLTASKLVVCFGNGTWIS